MKNKQFFILILLLVIGFASISATLVINGNMKVAANLDDFNVIFIEGFLNGEESSNVEIDSTKKVLKFTTNKLTNINDTARVDYKVKNISTQYDGDVTINCTSETNDYVNITSYFDGKALPLTNSINMQAQEVKSGFINAELTKATTEEQEVKITCKIEVTATSRTNYAYSLIFDSDGGSTIDDKSVTLNEPYGELSIPEKEGYTFVGWFNEDDVMVGSDTVFDSKGNKNLRAKWSKNAYPVSLKKVYSDRTENSEINIPYGEYIDTLITVGEEYYISNIECTNGYTIDNFNKDNIIYNEQTIRINNNKVAKESSCTITINKGIFAYSYTGAEQELAVPLNGNYKVELWGAGVDVAGGAYTSGEILLTKDKLLYVYVGGQQQSNSENIIFNSGTKSIYYNSYYRAFSSSGATDLRLFKDKYNNFSSLKSRIMVAAGAGGHDNMYNQRCTGGSGGGLIGYNGTIEKGASGGFGRGATQISGGASFNAESGKFGLGAQSNPGTGTDIAGCGGGGYYGGGSGYDVEGSACGGGGSSFISGHNGCDAITENSTSSNIVHTGQPNHYSGLVFTDTIMIDGAGYNWTTSKGSYTGMPSHDGTSTMTGNIGDGYAKITYLGK